ncbi:MCE family protein [Nocardia rhizosphaerihabitans]|uniref:MCE family protein n=1 Tax=Nocardia rhizosphaerihabitans TaxID=1691570 RepID=UPI00367229EC
MRRYENRNTLRAGLVGGVLVLATVATVSSYDRLPVLNSDNEIRAIFADAGGLKTGDRVEFSGVNVGSVRDIMLRGTDVEVTMRVRTDLALGAAPSAQARTRTALGRKAIVLTPSADGKPYDYTSVIPLERTRSPYDLPTELGKLTDNVAGIDTDQLSEALHTTSGVLEETSPELDDALDGVARLSASLASRDETLRQLFADGSTVTGVLAERSRQINTLVIDGNRILAELDARRAAIAKLSHALSAVAQQISGLVDDNRRQLAPTLARLNSVLDLLERNKSSIDAALPGLVTYMGTLGEAVGSGPFFNAYVGNLIPGQFIQPFVDAALDDGRVPPPEAPR